MCQGLPKGLWDRHDTGPTSKMWESVGCSRDSLFSGTWDSPIENWNAVGISGHECYVCISMQDYGGLGAYSPRKFDALRLLLRPFWDKSRVVVATWLAGYCIQFLAVLICICLAR